MAKSPNSKPAKAAAVKKGAKMEKCHEPFELPPTRDLYTTTTTILVGPQVCPTAFHVHSPLLVKHSAFFAAALRSNSPFIESVSESNTVRLPDFEGRVFAYFVQWLYTQSLAHEGLDDKNPPEFFWLVKLWKMAGYLQTEVCRNAVLDKVAQVSDLKNSVPSSEDISNLWEDDGAGQGDRGNGGLRALVLDLYTWKHTKQALLNPDRSWDDQFMRELVVKMKEKEPVIEGVPMIYTWKDPVLMCQTYHEHRTTNRCHMWIEKKKKSPEKMSSEKKL